MSKNLDETVRLQSEKREKERDYKGSSSASRVAKTHQPRRFPGETSVRGPIVA